MIHTKFKSTANSSDQSTRRLIVSVVTGAGERVEIYACEHSGRVITRKKRKTATGVYHPGIIIGKDAAGNWWVAHNHYQYGRPVFEKYSNYLKGGKGYWDNRKVYFDPGNIVARAICEIKKGKSYHAVSYNCQTFVNIVVQDKQYSESVNKLSGAAMFAGALVAVLGAASKNKTATVIGASVFGVGAGTNLYNRYKK